MKINRCACTLQSIIILRYLHSCGKKTKLRQGCTPWYNMLDIHGFNPNSTKSSNVFFRDRHFILRHVKKLGLEGNLGTTTSQQSVERLLDPAGYGVRYIHGIIPWSIYLDYCFSVNLGIMNPVAINEAKKVLRREIKKRITTMSDELKLKESISIVNKVKFKSWSTAWKGARGCRFNFTLVCFIWSNCRKPIT